MHYEDVVYEGSKVYHLVLWPGNKSNCLLHIFPPHRFNFPLRSSIVHTLSTLIAIFRNGCITHCLDTQRLLSSSSPTSTSMPTSKGRGVPVETDQREVIPNHCLMDSCQMGPRKKKRTSLVINFYEPFSMITIITQNYLCRYCNLVPRFYFAITLKT